MILMNDFKKEYSFLKQEIDSSITRCLESGWYILGEEVTRFEKQFASHTGTHYSLGVANGLEALQVALMSLGIGEGDEVITVSNSAVATALAITNTGASPVFVDVDQYYLMDVAKIEEKITNKTKAIVPVHLFGQLADMTEINSIAKKHNLYVVEDACQGHGAALGNKKAGSFGALGCFSFYPTKNLGAFGDGGAITTDSQELYEKCKMLRNYGQKNRYEHEIKGLNSRLDEIQAAILSVKLEHLDNFISKRKDVARLYTKRLSSVPQVRLPLSRTDSSHSFHLFVINVENRDSLMEYLKNNQVNVLIHYPTPIHKQLCYSEYNDVNLPQTETFAKSILSLPIHPFLEVEEVEKVCDLIKKYYEQT